MPPPDMASPTRLSVAGVPAAGGVGAACRARSALTIPRAAASERPQAPHQRLQHAGVGGVTARRERERAAVNLFVALVPRPVAPEHDRPPLESERRDGR